jgi:hypothetical protein
MLDLAYIKIFRFYGLKLRIRQSGHQPLGPFTPLEDHFALILPLKCFYSKE